MEKTENVLKYLPNFASTVIAPRRYVLTVVIVTLIIAGWGMFVCWLFLVRSGELNLPRVLALQLENPNRRFGSAVRQDNYTYKVALFKELRPIVAALGSSRVMQLHPRYFRDRFVNMGGAVGSIASLESFADMLLKGDGPRVILLGIDFWWFNSNYPEADRPWTPPKDSYSLKIADLKIPITWWKQGKVSLQDILTTINAEGKIDNLGVMARQQGDGFDGYGYYHYQSLWTGQRKSDDIGFRDTLDRIADGKSRFEHGTEPDANLVARFVTVVQRLQHSGITVVVFMPPLAPAVFHEIQERSKQYGHLFDLQDTMRAAGINVIDYTDSSTLSATDCEFIDGFHGGEIVYARMLNDLDARVPELEPLLDKDMVRDALVRGGGSSVLPETVGGREIDFLQLGCRKHPIM